MKIIHSLLILTALSMIGCAHQARHFDAPNSSAMRGSNARLGAAVVSAKAAAQSASEQTAQQKAQIATVAPKLATLFRVAPPELRPVIANIQADVAEMQDRQSAIEQHQTELLKQLEEAETARVQHDTDQAKYIADAAKITDQLNASEAAWAKDAKALQYYRVHWFIGWIVLLGGVAACCLLAFLKFTGRVAITSAQIASKL